MEDRLMDLEIKVAFVERQIAELDEVVREAVDAMGTLRAELERIRETVKAGPVEPNNDLLDEVPPHYGRL